MNEYTFSVHLCESLADMEATRDELTVIIEGLHNNITKKIGNVELERLIRIFIRNKEHKVVGGIVTNIFGQYVYIVYLWVEDSLRNRGYGTKLLNMAEKEAMNLGCKYAHTDTFSFEARPFYEKNGYQLFGMLDDYIGGHSKFFLRKTLIGT